jgi:hypothetical protein
MRSQREVVVLVPREARQVEHDHGVELALVSAAELQHPAQLGAVSDVPPDEHEARYYAQALIACVTPTSLQHSRHGQGRPPRAFRRGVAPMGVRIVFPRVRNRKTPLAGRECHIPSCLTAPTAQESLFEAARLL